MAAAIRVLYVDDEPSLLNIGKLFLEESGDFTVTTALSGTEGIRLLEQENFDTIISDYQMPGMDGIQFLVEVRKRFGPIPFILFTGRGREEVVIQAINSGADFYLQKGGEPGAQFAELTHKIKSAASSKRADDALRKSEEKYRHLIEHSDEAIVVVQEGVPKLVNHQTIEFTGYSEQELLSMSISAFIHPDDRAMVMERYQKRMKGDESPSRYSFRLIPRDGSTRWVEISIAMIDWEGYPATLNFLTDITSRKQAEDAIRTAEDTYRNIFLNSQIGLFRTDVRTGLLLDVNDTVARFIGYPDRASLLAKPFNIVERYADAYDHEKIISLLKADGEFRNYEARFVKNDDSIIWMRFSGRLVKEKGWVEGVSEDITERKRAEDALCKSEERYRTIYDQSPIAIELYDATGTLVHINPAGLNLFGIKNILEIQNFSLFADPNVNDEQKERLHKGETVQYSGPFDFEKVKALNLYTTSREGIIWLDVLITPLGNRADSITGFLVQIQDITGRKQIEKAHRESEERFRLITETIDEAFWMADVEIGKIFYVSPSFERIWGLSRESLYKNPRSFLDAIHNDDRERVLAELEIEKTGQPFDHEYRIVLPDGNIRNIWDRGFPIRDEKGQISIYAGIAIDITERKRAEEVLRESEATFRIHIENSFDVIFTLNSDGEFVFVSPAWERHFGYPVSDVIGKSFAPFVHPDDIAPLVEYLKRVLITGQCEASPAYRVRHADGRWLWFIANGTPIVNTKGERQFVGVGHDITERKVAEEALKEHDEKIHLLLDSTAEAIYGLDLNGNCTFCNNSCLRLLGYKSPDELLGKNMHWQIHHKHPDGTHFPVEDCRIFRAFNKGEGTHVDDEVLWRSDGTSFPAEYWSYPQRHEGKVVGAVVTFIDITERKELEKEMEYHALELRQFSTSLAAANKKLNLLSSITRHDINNQLTVLMGFLAILKKKQSDPTLNEYCSKASNAAQRISAMIQFTKEYDAIGVSTPVWQDVRTVLDTAAKQAPLGKIIVKNDLPTGQEVFADPLVVKVFYNLMDNAVRYGGKITTIRFSVQEADDDHLIICEDDGDGVIAEEKEKIFERGFGKNTGLGLALSREILSITGITIRETGEPGKGARFEMTVPKGAWRMAGKSV